MACGSSGPEFETKVILSGDGACLATTIRVGNGYSIVRTAATFHSDPSGGVRQDVFTDVKHPG